MSDWLQNLKPGDEVIVRRSGWGSQSTRTIQPVVRVTATIITAGKGGNEAQYNRKTGQQRGADRYFYNALEEPTPEALEEVREIRFRAKVLDRLRGVVDVQCKDVTTDQLRRICEILDESSSP